MSDQLRARVRQLEEKLAAAEARLHFNADLYAKIFDPSPFPVWITFQGPIVYINPAGLALLNARVDQVVGRSPFDFIAPAFHETVAARIAGIEAGRGASVALEQTFLRLDGAEVNVQVSAWLIPYLDSHAIRVSFIDVTEKKKIERHLAESQAEVAARLDDFETLFASMPVAVSISEDPECRVIRSNVAMERMLGVPTGTNTSKSRPDAQRMPFRFCRNGVDIPPEDLPQQKAGREGVAVEDVELELVRADGQTFYLYGSATPLWDKAGKVRGTLAAYIDVTGRRLAEQALKQSEERFRRFLETCACGVVFGRRDGTIFYANPTFLGMVGYSSADVARTKLRWNAITAPECAERDRQALDEVETKGVSTPYEKTYIARDGHRVPVLIGLSREASPWSREDIVFALCIDITDRKSAEAEVDRLNAELKKRIDELETVIRIAPVGLGIANDPECAEIRANPYLQQFLGLPEDAEISKTSPAARPAYRVLDHGVEVLPENLPMQLAARTGQPVRDRAYEIERADNSHGHLLCHAAPLHDANGKPRGAIGAFVDITDRNHIEIELRHSNADLTQLAYAVSHDLREPLRMMITFSQLLDRRLKSELAENAQQWLGYIVEGARRMEALLGDLLTYSRLGSTAAEPAALVDSGEVMNRVLFNLKPAIEEAHASIEVHRLPDVMAHEVHVVQVFQNLVGNAVKYKQPHQAPRIVIAAVEHEGEWVFSVSDNGIGIAPVHHEQVFRIFKRLHHTDEYSGTGIGLALCKRIVESYGGRIWVDSALGHGATFFFTLPVASHANSR